ncbi:MAG: VOC family protein [Phycisphaerales bacterium JB059]
MEIQLDHVAVFVSDLDRSKAFYAGVLGLEDAYPGQWDGSPTIMMAPGSRTGVALFPAEIAGDGRTNKRPGAIDHFAFRTSREAQDELRSRLERDGIEHRVKEFGICHSVFVHDPDGVEVEITTYDERR